MLIYLGGLKSNGITTSGLNLLRNIDHRASTSPRCTAHPPG